METLQNCSNLLSQKTFDISDGNENDCNENMKKVLKVFPKYTFCVLTMKKLI